MGSCPRLGDEFLLLMVGVFPDVYVACQNATITKTILSNSRDDRETLKAG